MSIGASTNLYLLGRTMSLRKQGANEDWEIPTTSARRRVLAWVTLPLGRLALLAAALVMAYLVLGGTFLAGDVSPATAQDQYAGALTDTAPVNAATACVNPGYQATLVSPSVPDSSDTYIYEIDGSCQPEDIDFVMLSGCWEIEDIKEVHTSAGFVEKIAPGFIVFGGIGDDDMPLTLEIMFHVSLMSGDQGRTWIWVHTGPADNDGWTSVVGGPFCDESMPTTSPTPQPTPSPTPPPSTDLTIVKTDSPDPVTIGGTLAYTVTVNNIGAITAEDVFVTDTLPDHVSLVSSTPSLGSCDGTICSLGNIAAGESAVISYVALVSEGAESPIVNVVCAMTSSVETDLTNNCDEEETAIKTPLAATSTPNIIPPMGGSPFGGGGSAGPSLLLVLGAGFVVIGAIAGFAVRRRLTNKQ